MAGRGPVSNQHEAGVGLFHRLNSLPGRIAITVSAEDDPNTNERLVTFQAYRLDGTIYDGYICAWLTALAGDWGALEGTAALDMAGADGTTGTGIAVHDGLGGAATLGAFEHGYVRSNSTGKIAVIVNESGNETYTIMADYGGGLLVQTAAFTFGSG